MNYDSNISQKELYENGWTVVKNVFSSEEVNDLREKIISKESIKVVKDKGDVLSNPEIGNIVFDKRIVSILKNLLGGEVTYFCESRVLVESINGRKGGAFHRDNPDRTNPNGPDWKSKYDVVRVGIYLQDHKNFSEGLGLFDGSNRNPNFMPSSIVTVKNAPLEEGDILIWTMTTMHVGYPKKIKFFKSNNAIARGSILVYGLKYYLNNLLYSYLPFSLPRGKERIVIHIAYGKKGSKHTERYIEYCKKRLFAVKSWMMTKYSNDQIKNINQSEVDFLDMTQQCDENLYKNAGDHFELPY